MKLFLLLHDSFLFFIVTKIYPFIISRDFLNKSKKPQPQFSSKQFGSGSIGEKSYQQVELLC